MDPPVPKKQSDASPHIELHGTAERFKDYHIDIVWHAAEALRPDNECADVHVVTPGEVYWASVMTPKFFAWLFDKNATTGECVNGAYLSLPKVLFVREINLATVRKTIDDLVKKQTILEHFKYLMSKEKYMSQRDRRDIYQSDVVLTSQGTSS